MGCRKMDYFTFLLARQASVRELNGTVFNIKQGVRPVASRLGLIVEKAEASHR